MTVIRLDAAELHLAPDIEGILWAHEYGHTKGLNHRSDKDAVMYSQLLDTTRGVTADECNHYRSGEVAAAVMPGRAVTPGPTPTPKVQPIAKPDAEPFDKPNVESFVRRVYFEGLPARVAMSYTGEDSRRLVTMLGDPTNSPFAANIAATLGLIGDPVAVEPLIQFVHTDDGVVSDSRARGKLAAISALGYIANKSENRRALEFLVRGLRPASWSEIGWSVGGWGDERNRDLAKAAARGLGFSGSPEAEKALAEALTTDELAPLRAVLSDALKANRQIQQKGLHRFLLEKR